MNDREFLLKLLTQFELAALAFEHANDEIEENGDDGSMTEGEMSMFKSTLEITQTVRDSIRYHIERNPDE